MKFNNPIYGKSTAVVLYCDHNITDLMLFTLQQWLKQTYVPKCQIIIVSKQKNSDILFAFLKQEASRYGLDFSVNGFDGSIVLYTSPKDKQDAINEVVALGSADIIILPTKDMLPSPYFVDVAILAMHDRKIVISNDCVIFDKRIDPLSLLRERILLTSSCMYQCPNVDPRIHIFIPCMDRLDNLLETLPHWFNSKYSNYRIVIIDYNSEFPIFERVQQLCENSHKTISDKVGTDSDVLILRIEGQKFFNISHAYNWAIKQVQPEIIITTCADSVPWDYYLDTVVSCLTDENIVQIHWGLHAIKYSNWEKLNGHQEFVVGWGAEDDDFRLRACLMGLKLVILPSKLVFQIPNNNKDKSKNRQIPDLSESSLINQARFTSYQAQHGYVGNYGLPIGGDSPIEYKPIEGQPVITRMWCFRDKPNNMSGIQYSDDFKVYYKLSECDWQPEEVGVLSWSHYYISDKANTDKYLFAYISES